MLRMFVGITLMIALIFLLVSMALMIDLSYSGYCYVGEEQAALFVGLSVLAGACVVVIGLIFSSSHQDLHRAFSEFSSALEKGPLTRAELGREVGKGKMTENQAEQSQWSESQGELPRTSLSSEVSYLSLHQVALCNQLLYEGKLIERGGKLSLPG